MLDELHHLRAFDAAGVNLEKKRFRVMPPMMDRLFHPKLSWSKGVCPRGAQVLTRVGLVLRPLSSTKTTMRRWRRAFFL